MAKIMNILKQFEYSDWENYWAGNWSILSFSCWGEFYSRKPFLKDVNQFLKNTIITWVNGKSSCYFRHSEKAVFASKIVKTIEKKGEPFILDFCEQLKQNANVYFEVVEQLKDSGFSLEDFNKHLQTLLNYYPYHITNKVIVDFLPKGILEKYFHNFEEARIYGEPVFTKELEFTKAFCKWHAGKTGYSPALISAMVKDEFENYLATGKLQEKEVLKKRNEKSAYLFLNGRRRAIILDKDFGEVEQLLFGGNTSFLKGTCAYPGKVKGIAKIVIDPSSAKAGNFREGMVLVAGMTRPEYLSLMKKASAIITDAGGMLCHAAIVARELKKPCVIGTQKATKVLKDGDLVEVDAGKGEVHKIT